MNQPNSFLTRFSWLIEPIITLLISCSGIFSIAYLLCLNQPIDLIHYRLTGLSLPDSPLMWYLLPTTGVLLLIFMTCQPGKFQNKLASFNQMLSPLLIPLPVILLAPNSYWTTLLLIAAVGVAGYRAGTNFTAELLVKWRQMQNSSKPCFKYHAVPQKLSYCLFSNRFAAEFWNYLKRKLKLPHNAVWYLIGAAFIAEVIWGYILQRRAYDSMFLHFSDWGEYAENYLRLAFSENNKFTDFLAVAGHWNPAINLLMSGALRLVKQPDTIFLINTLVISSVVPLSFILGRSLKLPSGLVLGWAIIALLNPVIANQPLALFYGFHPINFMIPLILGFFICRARNSRRGMIILFLLSLLIQETVAIFWSGYAIYLMLKRRYTLGIALFLCSVIFFWLISNMVMPHLFTHDHYSQMFHYSQLGNTPLEVLLSPFLRPARFWQTILQWQNFAFAAGLLAPVWLALLIHPQLAIATLPLLAGVCLQNSPELKNLAMQYGVEITTLLLTSAIINTAAIYQGAPNKILNLLNCKVKAAKHRTARAGGLTIAMLLGGVFVFLLFGQYAYQRIKNLPSGTKVLNHIFSKLPQGNHRVIATERLRAHALFKRTTYPLKTAPQSGDIVMLDLHDPSNSARILEEMRAHLTTINTRPIAWANWYGSQIVCFEVDPAIPPPGAPPFLRQIPDSEFHQLGQPLLCQSPDFELRLQKLPNYQAALLIRLRQKVNYDVDLRIHTVSDGKQNKHTISYAYGLIPAYMQPQNQVFILKLPTTYPEQIAVEIIRRPESGPKSTRL